MNDYIVLIEDDDDHAELAEFYISEVAADKDLIRLRDGHEAIAFVEELSDSEQKTPWLILLDLKLPKYDGHEVLAKIKASDKLITCPVVVFTTSNSNRDIERAYRGNVNSYVIKPTDADMYEETIKRIISYWALDQHSLVTRAK